VSFYSPFLSALGLVPKFLPKERKIFRGGGIFGILQEANAAKSNRQIARDKKYKKLFKNPLTKPRFFDTIYKHQTEG
jgi:hypothetical protein